MDDIEAIKQLKARYFRLMDTKDWDGMREVFADDVFIDTTDSGGRTGGTCTAPATTTRNTRGSTGAGASPR